MTRELSIKNVLCLGAMLLFCVYGSLHAQRGPSKPRGPDSAGFSTKEREQDILGSSSLTLPAPVGRWDNALPLGNGLTGGLLWGKDQQLNLSLDRGDLWDERSDVDLQPERRNLATLLKCIETRDTNTLAEVFKAVNDRIPWTKIPGGRLEIKLSEKRSSKSFHLDFEKAVGTVTFSDGARAEVFFSATQPISMLRLPKGTSFNLLRPASIGKLGYPDPTLAKTANEVFYTQNTTEKFNYAVVAQWKEYDDHILAVISITNSNEADDPLALARDRIGAGFKEGWDKLLEAHTTWWKDFYNRSTVQIPSPRLQHHYNLVKYLYGAGSRSHGKPMPLQGVWTADEGSLPPWRGDYHNDLNTQMTYVAWQAAGLVDSGMAYIRFYRDNLPAFRKYAREFFAVDGAMVPGVMTLGGQVMGGWFQYSFQPTAGLWNGHAAYRHWKITRDSKFLAEEAYPWLAEIADTVFSLCVEKDGKLKLPFSSSPEWNDGKWTAYLKPNSNYDQALLLWASDALREMAEALGKSNEGKKWAALHAKLEPLKLHPETGELLVAEGVSFSHAHRHFSHTLAIHPLGLLNIHQSPKARKSVLSSVNKILKCRGKRGMTGYSYTWAASLPARAGLGDEALVHLVDFERAFLSRNGFHQNGDQTFTIMPGQRLRSYRLFTLEGNFLFMDAVQEMLMRSIDDVVYLFPAVPSTWKDLSFRNLRAEGGFKVSGERKQGNNVSVKIEATVDYILKLSDPFDGGGKWSTEPENDNGLLVFKMKAGDILTGVVNSRR